MIFLVACSDSRPLFITYPSSSPPAASSIIIISCFASMNAWYNSIMFLCRSFLRFCASLKIDDTAFALVTMTKNGRSVFQLLVVTMFKSLLTLIRYVHILYSDFLFSFFVCSDVHLAETSFTYNFAHFVFI